MSDNDRTISKRPDGKWANKKNGASRASSVHDTQKEAIQTAKDQLRNSGGGDLTVQGLNGKFRSKDTIGKSDPNPPKDTEH